LPPHPNKSLLFLLSATLLVLGVYSYPTIKTAATTGSRILPALSAPDTSLYLNISTVRAASSGEVVDPYYGVTVRAARMGYLKFRVAFLLFGGLNTLLHGNLWWSLLLWNLFWWGLLCVAAWWLFEQFLPDSSPVILLAALAVLMFFNFGILQNVLAAWRHLPSLHGFESVQLPYIRPFFPQVPIPLLILYLGLQIKAMQKRAWWIWAAMAVTQFIAFTVFPYAMLMMVGITAVTALGQLVPGRGPLRWSTLLFYAIACALSDLLFFFHGDQAARSGAPGQYSLIHIQISVLPHRIGGMWLILAALTALVFFIRDVPPEVKWPVTGLGLSNLFLLIGDVFFSETTVQMSQHGGYFVQLTSTVLLVFLVSAGLSYLGDRKRVCRLALGGIAALLLLNGALVADATYRVFLPTNEEQAAFARLLQSDPPQASDLVIAHSLNVDDDCAWVPLASSSHALFCRNAQVLLSPQQNDKIQRFRQALYLYFTNRDTRWVENVLNDPLAVTELTRLMFLGQVTTDAADREKGIDSVRSELIPFLAEAENKNPDVKSFFSRYRRVLVIDSVANPYFVDSRLSTYLKIEHQQTWEKLRILNCSPLEP
jgi:hypothetical protein